MENSSLPSKQVTNLDTRDFDQLQDKIVYTMFFFIIIVFVSTGLMLAWSLDFHDTERCHADFHQIKIAIDDYQTNCKQLPIKLKYLVIRPKNIPQWQGPYLDRIPLDVWSNPYKYKLLSSTRYVIISLGPDGRPGGYDDIRSDED